MVTALHPRTMDTSTDGNEAFGACGLCGAVFDRSTIGRHVAACIRRAAGKGNDVWLDEPCGHLSGFVIRKRGRHDQSWRQLVSRGYAQGAHAATIAEAKPSSPG
jgi:hypothetical protein